jgi:long-chain acyl-CoA synthetase
MPFVLRKTITETFLERVRVTPHVVGFQYKPTYPEAGPVGQWKQVTYRDFNNECRLIAFGLMGLGLKKGERAVILSNTRFEWPLCDMAILGAAGVTVPIYASNTAEDCAYILNHCEAKVAFLENDKQLEKILEKRAELKHLEKIVVFEPAAMQLAPGAKDVMTLSALKELGKREEAKEPTRFEKNLSSAQPDDPITYCYTSGTTGVPKGAILTHDNIMSVIEDAIHVVQKFVEPEKEVTVAFLPLSHIIGKIESMASYSIGWRECYAENFDTLMTNIGEVRPTVLFSVPRIFEKAYNRITAMVDAGSPAKRKLFYWGRDAGKKYFAARRRGETPSLKEAVEYHTANALVFKKIQNRFGGRLKFALCGGAPLPREIGEAFQAMGVPIVECYGLTETAAPVSMTSPGDIRYGTVGRPLPEVSLKIAEDGEILVKSRKVFQGYYKMPEETSQALQDGWFHTGDIGHLDGEGFLHITDRKKDLIITSGGKNVAPQKIENLAKTHKFISQFVVHGDRRHYLTALVTLDKDQIVKYANEQQILFSAYPELVKNPKIESLVQKLVDEVNSGLASFETIKKFIILPQDFTIETGELTPSLKVKRSLINRKFQAELDSMYTV